MIKVEDPSILEGSARDEYQHPLPQKSCSDGRTIYLSRNDFGISQETTGIIQITDFDLSCRYLELRVMLWDVLEGKKLFKSPPPKELLGKGTRTDLFYKPDGQFKGTTTAPSNFNFENSICHIHNEDKRMFIESVRATKNAIRHITLSLVITSPPGSLLFYLYTIHFTDSIQTQFRFNSDSVQIQFR
ncbi:hypothetical protein ACN38_g11771, partial [Penicillium nordicum]